MFRENPLCCDTQTLSTTIWTTLRKSAVSYSFPRGHGFKAGLLVELLDFDSSDSKAFLSDEKFHDFSDFA